MADMNYTVNKIAEVLQYSISDDKPSEDTLYQARNIADLMIKKNRPIDDVLELIEQYHVGTTKYVKNPRTGFGEDVTSETPVTLGKAVYKTLNAMYKGLEVAKISELINTYARLCDKKETAESLATAVTGSISMVGVSADHYDLVSIIESYHSSSKNPEDETLENLWVAGCKTYNTMGSGQTIGHVSDLIEQWSENDLGYDAQIVSVFVCRDLLKERGIYDPMKGPNFLTERETSESGKTEEKLEKKSDEQAKEKASPILESLEEIAQPDKRPERIYCGFCGSVRFAEIGPCPQCGAPYRPESPRPETTYDTQKKPGFLSGIFKKK